MAEMEKGRDQSGRHQDKGEQRSMGAVIIRRGGQHVQRNQPFGSH